MNTTTIEYPIIDMPINIVSFDAYRYIDNPNVFKLPNKTKKCEFPTGITITVRTASSNVVGHSKWFEVYFVSRSSSQNGRSFINRKFILRMFKYREDPTHPFEWSFEFNGQLLSSEWDSLEKVKLFLLEFVEEFKV